ncbi:MULTISPECIES: heme ABC transporter ATP-binding protein [Pseudoalteromonas]|uniref:heme ABC transporter ATP-binding protein n=1 Tax=Pseudoalteromonas TaxID=53246 RepID=UPI0002FED73D|nr:MULTISPECIES: heme ABC transporter ATP-binding protein [Pseudoalteromonas]MCF6146256.1 iron complex transport system ATP-binding protein [Pseudoalteromonas mariniglutinosa NCIMB 1770]TMN71948.1 heme ABC transporter ATP-binding protein [Pseudoalteromonas sp. S1727]
MLTGNQLSATVGQKVLLDNVDFVVKPYEVVVIIGPNGAGKSSLLKALCGDIPLSHGTVSINQRALAEYTITELATLRAVLTQNYELDFPFTVNEVVDMAHFAHQEQQSSLALKRFSHNAMQALGISHLAQQCFTRLSGGEKQRTQLARVLCQLQPSLVNQQSAYLLIDEPTSSLDLYHQYEVMNQARLVAEQGAGVVAVVHDLSLAASFADRIYMLNEGRVVAAGSPQQVLTQARLNEVYKIDAKLQTNLDNVLPHIIITKQVS